jgi:hypothetical protein
MDATEDCQPDTLLLLSAASGSGIGVVELERLVGLQIECGYGSLMCIFTKAAQQ